MACSIYLIASTGSLEAMGGLYTLLLMWCPALAAIITSLIFFGGIKEFGWRPDKIKYLIAVYMLPVIYAVIAYGIFWIFRLGIFTGHLPSNIIYFITVGSITSIISVLGE